MSATSLIKRLTEEVRESTSSPGVAGIAAERLRQLERWDPERDDALYNKGELMLAAACYLESAYGTPDPPGAAKRWYKRLLNNPHPDWPWSKKHWKPTSRVRMLEKAGGLIAAELDRLSRLDSPTEAESGE